MDRETTIQNALQAFKFGDFPSIRAAARAYEVSPATLARRVKGSTSARKHNEPRQACNEAEEEAIVAWIQLWQKRGFPVRHDMLKATAEYIMAQRNGTYRRETLSTQVLSRTWSCRFVNRHPFLKSIMSRPIEQERTEACTRENFEKWFNVYRDATTTYKVAPCNIYNLDETGFQMGDTARSYVIIDKRLGTKGYTGRGSNTENITVIECGCMDGTVLSPFIIFKGKNLQSTWFSEDAPNDWMAVTSDSGWTNNLLAITWLKEVFDKHTRAKAKGGPRILIIDGHSSHVSPEFLEHCENRHIVVLCLPAHTSHILQPMDRMFPSYKHWFRREVDKHLRCGEKRITKAYFMDILARSRPMAFTSKNVQSGFAKTGLNPFNPASALRQLPLLPLTPPRPVIPLEFQTPKDLAALRYCINMSNACPSDGLEAGKIIRAKIDKAATTAMTKIAIFDRETAERNAFLAEQQAKHGGKRRRVLGGAALTVGNAKEKTKAKEKGSSKPRIAPATRNTRSRKRPATPDSPEESSAYPSDSDSSYISECIALEVRK